MAALLPREGVTASPAASCRTRHGCFARHYQRRVTGRRFLPQASLSSTTTLAVLLATEVRGPASEHTAQAAPCVDKERLECTMQQPCEEDEGICQQGGHSDNTRADRLVLLLDAPRGVGEATSGAKEGGDASGGVQEGEGEGNGPSVSELDGIICSAGEEGGGGGGVEEEGGKKRTRAGQESQ